MIISSETFTLVRNLVYTITTLQTGLLTANSRRVCGGVCLTVPDCGGFVWDTTLSPPCQIVVDPRVPGAVPSKATSAYRRLHFRGRKIVEPPVDFHSWNSAADACAALNAKLIDYPKTFLERGVILIRGTLGLFVDQNNKLTPTTPTYIDKYAVPIVIGYLEWMPTHPLFVDNSCLMLTGLSQKYFAKQCPYVFDNISDIGVMCIEE